MKRSLDRERIQKNSGGLCLGFFLQLLAAGEDGGVAATVHHPSSARVIVEGEVQRAKYHERDKVWSE